MHGVKNSKEVTLRHKTVCVCVCVCVCVRERERERENRIECGNGVNFYVNPHTQDYHLEIMVRSLRKREQEEKEGEGERATYNFPIFRVSNS